MPVKHATSPVPGLLAQLNSTVLSLMDRTGVRNVARQMRSFDAHWLLFGLLELESPGQPEVLDGVTPVCYPLR